MMPCSRQTPTCSGARRNEVPDSRPAVPAIRSLPRWTGGSESSCAWLPGSWTARPQQGCDRLDRLVDVEPEYHDTRSVPISKPGFDSTMRARSLLFICCLTTSWPRFQAAMWAGLRSRMAIGAGSEFRMTVCRVTGSPRRNRHRSPPQAGGSGYQRSPLWRSTSGRWS